MNGQMQGPQHNQDFGSDQQLARRADPKHPANECRLLEAIGSDRSFKLFRSREPGRSAAAKSACNTSKDGTSPCNREHSKSKRKDTWSPMVGGATASDYRKTNDA